MPPRKPPCGNPLWLSWVKELRDEAQEKGLKSYESYTRSCQSIEACPVPYTKPRDMISLRGVGDKTIKIVEKRWEIWLIDHPEEALALAVERGPMLASTNAVAGPSRATAPTQRSKGISKAQLAKAGLSSGSESESAPEYDSSGELLNPKAPKFKKAKTTTRKTRTPTAYIPAPQSGGYGILMALILAIEEPWRTTTVFQSRDEIVKVAQRYCSSSYEKGEKNAYMTAWKSVKTLVGKGYVYERGRPATFCLTEEGYNVAVSIRNLAMPEHAAAPQYPFLQTDDPLPNPSSASARPSALALPPPTNQTDRTLTGLGPSLGPQPDIEFSDDDDLEVEVEASALPFPQALPAKRAHVDPLEALRGATGRTGGMGSRAHLEVGRVGGVEDGMAKGKKAEREKPRVSSGMFGFWYIDAEGARVETLSDAFIKLDPNTFTILRKLCFRAEQLSHPFVRQLKDVHVQTGDASVYNAFITEEGAPPMCSGFSATATAAPPKSADPSRESGFLEQMARFSGSANAVASGSPSALRAKASRDIGSSPVSASSFARTASAPLPPPVKRPAPPTSTAVAAADARNALPSLSRSASLNATAPSKSISARDALLRTGPRMTAHREAPSALFQFDPTTTVSRSTEPLAHYEFRPEYAVIFPPGSYKIVLALDSRENENFFGKERCSDLLRARGVEVDVRALRIGDMCWIAQRIDGGVGGEMDECVLDYVVERKRLDDLLSSLTDGRYHEQKFRLAQSCLSRVYYIIEDWQKAKTQGEKLGALQINTAKSQTAIIDGFFLKETHKFTETLDYLATLSEIIIETSRNQPLYVIPPRYVSRATYPALQKRLREAEPDKAYLTSYDAFQTLNDKTASRTLKERFGRMLLCVKGLSAEKVGDMLEKWETPRELYESLKRRLEEEPEGPPLSKKHRGPELFFADQFAHEGRRKIGDALSRDLWKIFMD